MSSKKAAAPAKKAAAKAPAKAAAKPAAAPARSPPKAAVAKGAGGVPPSKAGNVPAAPNAVPAGAEEAPPVVPKGGLQKVAGRDTLCQIEILKDGHFFIARTQTEGAADKEYKNTVFEDLLTEMVITLQEQMADH